MTQAEELLKEAAKIFEDAKEQISHLQDMCAIKDLHSTRAVNKGIDTLVENIQRYLKSHEPSPASVPPALTWEQAKLKIANGNGSLSWSDWINSIYSHNLMASYPERLSIMKAAFEQAAALMEANRPQRWIPVEERLPETEHNIYVLVWIPENQSVFTSCYYDDLGFTTPAGARGKITHWQPLPEVPK